MSAIVLSVDLMDRSKFPSDCRFVPSAAALQAAVAAATADVTDATDANHGPVVVALDLSRPDALAAADALAHSGHEVWVVGYGGHVNREQLREAAVNGCHRVLARSVFFADIEGALTSP